MGAFEVVGRIWQFDRTIFYELGIRSAIFGAINDWELKRYPVSFIVAVILANIHEETSFYTIDPRDTERFECWTNSSF